MEANNMDEIEIKLKEEGKIRRLTDKTFQLDERIKDGYFSANYFLKTRKIVAHNAPGHLVEEQWFQRRNDSMVCGIDECIAILHKFATHPETLEIWALHDGDLIQSGEPVLKVTGKYEDFGYLESIIDGILARRSSVATNTMAVVRALRGHDCFSMADRQDDYVTQRGDGYATYVAGIKKFSTDAQGEWVGVKGMGTMPHALIEICGGDICKAVDLYHKEFPEEKVTALIDYHNNVVPDTIRVAKHLGKVLRGVRVDTSGALIDHYFDDKDTSGFNPHGVCKELIYGLKKALVQEGLDWVKITVSSGFTAEKIDAWTKEGVPVDMYGVGSYLVINNTVGFTGDLVKLDGVDEAKEGRRDIPSARLEKVSYPVNR
jgi:nicotinate phosphoribosyltransferase